MQYYDVIRKPVLSEKSIMMNEQSKYVFVVDKRSTKDTVKQAVENIFGVNVNKVNIMNVKGKTKRFKGTIGRTSDYKKAVVTLNKGQEIDLSGSIK
ncbi:MAG: rplW [Rickettsiaceae bacterium]|jgi:large subunit ribosomal protein L23|nr:rplW [Rickettsiaceae bacterium]